MRPAILRPPDPPDKRERRPAVEPDGESRNSFGQKQVTPYHKPVLALAPPLRVAP